MVLRVWHLLAFGVVFVATALAVGLMATGRQSSTTLIATSTTSESLEDVSLGDYFARVKVQQDRFLSAEADGGAALDSIGPVPDKNWATAAVAFQRERDAFTDIAIQLRLIRPPSALATEHEGLTKSVELFAASADGLQQALADSDQQGIINASQRINDQQIVELRTAWRNAVIAYARTADVSVPGWVTEVGTRS
jgi:hypothetical protein